jgi:hypothetical protein
MPHIQYGVNAMRTAFNFEPNYRVTMLTRVDWTKGIGTLPAVKGLIWFTDGSKMKEGTCWTCWHMRKWNCWQARKRQLCSKFVGPEPVLGVSGQDIRRRIRSWLVIQHWVWWRSLSNAQWQALELILEPCLGPLTGHNPGLLTGHPQPIFFVSVKPWLHSDSIFLEPEDIKSIKLGAIRKFSKVTGLP